MIIGMIIFIVFVILGIIGIIDECNSWNRGVCKITGKQWKRFDTDSQGGRGYCDGIGNYTWISYPLIDRQKAD